MKDECSIWGKCVVLEAENDQIAYLHLKSSCVFTFLKRFARGPESAVICSSFSCVARYFVEITRDRSGACFTSRIGLFEVLFLNYLICSMFSPFR